MSAPNVLTATIPTLPLSQLRYHNFLHKRHIVNPKNQVLVAGTIPKWPDIWKEPLQDLIFWVDNMAFMKEVVVAQLR